MADLHYSITKFHNNLTDVLHLIEDGNAVELMRNGKTVAVVISVWQYHQLQPSQRNFWQALQTFRQEFHVAELPLEDGLFADVRDRATGREVTW
jgi:antitoxin (DNA-binding transcriptional repressor) of toxin-antitoxin stability system